MSPSRSPATPAASNIAPQPVHISTPTLYVGAAAAFVVAGMAASLGVSYLLCASECTPWLGTLCKDDHYKYLVPLLVPTTAWFVIANWVGWEFFRNA